MTDASRVQFRALVVDDEQPLPQAIHGYLAAEGFPNGAFSSMSMSARSTRSWPVGRARPTEA